MRNARLHRDDRQVDSTPVLHANDVLLLDLDGTVIDIAARPDAVFVAPCLINALRSLSAREPRGVVIVTGRALVDADRMLFPLRLPTIASHGAEWRVPGIAVEAPQPIGVFRGAIEILLKRISGAVLEWKPYSAAVHVRNAPEAAAAVLSALNIWVSANPDYRIATGRHVFEVVHKSISKAAAVERLLNEPPYVRRRPIYVGDDHADEAAMREVGRRGGIAMRVAGEYFESQRSTFQSPRDVREWLSLAAKRRLAIGLPATEHQPTTRG
jgi:trehalose 6-phosphate phosphatase